MGDDPIECCRLKLQQIAAQRGVGLRQAIDFLVSTVEGHGWYIAAQHHYANTVGPRRPGRRLVDGFVDVLCREAP
jgi:hypothetical protein